MAFLSMEFSKIYWSGLPITSPGVLPNSGTEPRSPLQANSTIWTTGSHKVWPVVLAENQTLFNFLEGSYDHHYTTNATLYISLKYLYPSLSTITDHIWICLLMIFVRCKVYILLFCAPSFLPNMSPTHFYTCFAWRIICSNDNIAISLKQEHCLFYTSCLSLHTDKKETLNNYK